MFNLKLVNTTQTVGFDSNKMEDKTSNEIVMKCVSAQNILMKCNLI